MRIRHFTAPNMAQAMRLVRAELGPEAVILSTGKTDEGVEIAAAVDTPPPAPAPAQPRPESAPQAPSAPPPGLDGGSEALRELSRQVENLRSQLASHMLAGEAAGSFALRPQVAPLYEHLCRQEVAPEIIQGLLSDLGAPGGQGILPMLAIRLKKLLRVAPAQIQPGQGPAVWALVGPTGVGKTTTVAKLAASFGLRQGLKVGLITLDTFRIAAAEQLKVYGRIMQVPTVVAATGREYQRAVDELGEMDLILVDTVGRAPGDEGNLAELRSILASQPETRCHLVLACPTRDGDQARITEAFGRFGPSSLIFTKLDETSVFGTILNQVVKTGIPVSFITTGQKVPDDMESATLDGLARLLLPRQDQPGR